MKLFLDTETTGVVHWKAPLTDIKQPRPVSIALVLTDDEGEVVNSFYSIVNCGRGCPQEATNIHGITEDTITRAGITPVIAQMVFNDFASKADLMIGHNIKFDETILKCVNFTSKLPVFCTMLASTKICKLPNKFNNGNFKWPKLEEAYKILCGKTIEGAHNALVDVMATIEIWKALTLTKTFCKSNQTHILTPN